MSTAYEMPNLRFSIEAGADITRRRFVKVNSSEKAVMTGAGERAVGVSAQGCSNGQVAEIYDGIVIVEAGAAITAGTDVQSDSSGRAVTLVTQTIVANASPATTDLPEPTKVGYALTGASGAGVMCAIKFY